MVVAFDENSMKVMGEPTALIEGMRVGAFGSADLAVSAAGTLVYATGGWEGKQELVWVTRDGKAQSVDPDWQGDFWAPALSPDGKRVAVSKRLDGLRIDIWIKQLDQGPGIKFTLEGGYNWYPTWTPDGRSVTFSSERQAPSICGRSGPMAARRRCCNRVTSVPRWRRVGLPTGNGSSSRPTQTTPVRGTYLGSGQGLIRPRCRLWRPSSPKSLQALSPDGRWLAYTSNETGQYEIYVVPFPNTSAAKWAVSTRGGTAPEWSHSGSELFYRDAARHLVAVDVNTNPTFSLGRSAVLFSTAGFAPYLSIQRYAVAPDDRRFLMIRPLATGTPDKLIVVENWFEELKAKLRK